MYISNLDRDLASCLSPLIDVNSVVRVAPFVNTLSLGVHYIIAHGPTRPSPQRVGLMDWNRHEDFSEHLTGFFIFYGSKNVAQKIAAISGPGSGFFDSLAITQYKQRYVFVRRTPITEELARSVDGKMSQRFLELSASRGLEICVYTDIVDQARELMHRTAPKMLEKMPAIRSAETVLLFGRPENSLELPLFVYGAPCVAYMNRAADTFIPLEIDEAVIASAPEYETHIIWHVPEGQGKTNQVIREALSKYHRKLFSSAEDAPNDEFRTMSDSCSDVLAARHPSFQAEVLADPIAFRMCLRDHHSAPLATRA